MKRLFVLALAGALLFTASSSASASARGSKKAVTPAGEPSLADPTAALTAQVGRVVKDGDVFRSEKAVANQVEALVTAYKKLQRDHATLQTEKDNLGRTHASGEAAHLQEKTELQEKITTLENQLKEALDAMDTALKNSAAKVTAALGSEAKTE